MPLHLMFERRDGRGGRCFQRPATGLVRMVWVADLPGSLEDPIEGDREFHLEKRTLGSVFRGAIVRMKAFRQKS